MIHRCEIKKKVQKKKERFAVSRKTTGVKLKKTRCQTAIIKKGDMYPGQ